MPPPTLLRTPLQAKLSASTMSLSLAIATAVTGVAAYTYATRPAKQGTPPFSSFGFKSLKLHTAELVNHNTKRLRFELPDQTVPSGLALTSALLTVAYPGGRWLPVLRPYTPVNDINEPGYVEFLVKLYPGGKQSSHLHSLKPGDTVTMAPIPGYSWKPNKHPHVALIAGGAGITPIYQLTRGILDNPEEKTRITLVWGVNNDADIFLRDELAAFEKRFPDRFKAVYVVSKPDAGSPFSSGYVTKKLLEDAGLTAALDKNKDTKVLVCGPPPMEKALVKGGILSELGYKPAQIFKF